MQMGIPSILAAVRRELQTEQWLEKHFQESPLETLEPTSYKWAESLLFKSKLQPGGNDSHPLRGHFD